MEEIEDVCTKDPKQFYNTLKKLGPRSNKTTIPWETYDESGGLITQKERILDKWKTDFQNLYCNVRGEFDENFLKRLKE